MLKLSFKHTNYACRIGGIIQAIVNNLTPLFFVIFQKEFHISYEMLGRLVLFNFATQFFMDIVAVKWADKMGYRLAVVLSQVFSCIGLVSLGTLPFIMKSPYVGIVISVIIYAVGGGLMEVLLSPVVEALPNPDKVSSMSFLHASYSWGQVGVVLISTVILKIFSLKIWYLLPIFWAIIPFLNAIYFLFVPIYQLTKEKNKMSVTQLLKDKTFVVFILLMVTSGASELTMSQWSSLFAEKGLGISKMWGDILGPCMFAVFMGVGRTAHGFLNKKISLEKLLFISSIAATICYVTSALTSVGIIGLISCSLCGLFVCMMWPGIFSLCSQKWVYGGTAMFGILAFGGDVGGSLGPWLLGVVSDFSIHTPLIADFAAMLNVSPQQMCLKFGMLLGAVFPLVFAICISKIKNQND